MSTPMPRHLEAELSMPFMKLPLRTTLVETEGARVLLVPASTLSEDEYRSLGEVTDIVAPNLFHLDGVPKAATASPKARLWGPKGSKTKLPNVAWTGILGSDPWPYEKAIAQIEFGGMPTFAENVFVDRASRSLVAGDLVFNLLQPKGPASGLVLRMFGTHKKFAASRLFFSAIKDKKAFQASAEKLLDESFERVIPAHGDVLESDGKAKVQAALRERGLPI